MSTTYYALFHCLARCCADTLVGRARAARNTPGWRQAYRALEHGHVRSRCHRKPTMESFPRKIRKFADCFVDLQAKRNEADYDPDRRWDKSGVAEAVTIAEDVIRDFEAAPLRARRAFAISVLLKNRNP